MTRQCEASYRVADGHRIRTVVACPDAACRKPDVAVTEDAFGLPVFEPHLVAAEVAA